MKQLILARDYKNKQLQLQIPFLRNTSSILNYLLFLRVCVGGWVEDTEKTDLVLFPVNMGSAV